MISIEDIEWEYNNLCKNTVNPCKAIKKCLGIDAKWSCQGCECETKECFMALFKEVNGFEYAIDVPKRKRAEFMRGLSRKEYYEQYRIKNYEKLKEQRHVRYLKKKEIFDALHKEVKKEYYKNYYEKNKDKYKDYNAVKYSKNKEEQCAKNRAYYWKHHAEIRARQNERSEKIKQKPVD